MTLRRLALLFALAEDVEDVGAVEEDGAEDVVVVVVVMPQTVLLIIH
jgi:hypothetical protein